MLKSIHKLSTFQIQIVPINKIEHTKSQYQWLKNLNFRIRWYITRTHSCWIKHISNKNAIDRKFCKHSRKINSKDYTNRFFWHGYRWVSTMCYNSNYFFFFLLSQIWQKPSENHSFNSKTVHEMVCHITKIQIIQMKCTVRFIRIIWILI